MKINKERLLTDLQNVKTGCIERNEPYDRITYALAIIINSDIKTEIINALIDADLAFFASAVSNEVYDDQSQETTTNI